MHECRKLLQLSREEINEFCSPSSTTPSHSDNNHDEAKLLISAVDISKMSMCPLAEVSEHFIRVVSQLWKVIVCGTSEADLRWANPAAVIPLRVQAFATLLQLLGSCTLFSSKRGLSQLDGSSKWNVIALSRVLALAFDEGSLFGKAAAEALTTDFFCLNKQKPPVVPLTKEKRRRHVRSNFEFLNNTPSGDGTYNLKDLTGGTDFLGGGISSHELLSSTLTAKSAEETLKTSVTSPMQEPIKVDSMTDFRTALKAGSESVEDDGLMYDGSSTGSAAALAMVKAYSGPQAMSRRWMTAPSPGLATIREDTDDDGESNTMVVNEPQQLRKDKGPLDALDAELLVKSNSTVKQMRVPNIRRKAGDRASTQNKDTSDEFVLKSSQPNHLEAASGSDPNQEILSE